jgi:hypothetical protein
MMNWLDFFAPKLPAPAARFDDRHRRQLREIHLDRPIELELVEQGRGGFGRRVATLELKLTEARLDRFGAEPAVMIRWRLRESVRGGQRAYQQQTEDLMFCLHGWFSFWLQ